MTHKILKSTLRRIPGGDDIQKVMDSYAAELTAWHGHHEAIRTQAALPPRPEWHDFKGSTKPGDDYQRVLQEWAQKCVTHRDPYPLPNAFPDVELSMVWDDKQKKFVGDFEIVDDDPTPDEILRGQKDALLIAITKAEHEAKSKVQLPLGKQRLANLREGAIRAADKERLSARKGPSLPMPIPTPMPVMSAGSAQEYIDRTRHPDDTKHLADQQSRREKVAAIELAAAQAMSAVEDLTADNIGSFEIPSFD
jgi:hypothetical protein